MRGFELGSSRRMPRRAISSSPLAASPVGRSTSPVLRPPTSFGPFAGGQGPALLDGCAKKCGHRTFWHNLALRLPVRAEVRTICRGYRELTGLRARRGVVIARRRSSRGQVEMARVRAKRDQHLRSAVTSRFCPSLSNHHGCGTLLREARAVALLDRWSSPSSPDLPSPSVPDAGASPATRDRHRSRISRTSALTRSRASERGTPDISSSS